MGERGHPATARGLLGAATSPLEGQGRAMPCTSAPAGQDVPYEPRSPRGVLQRRVHRRPSQPPSPPRGQAVHPVGACFAAPGCPHALRHMRSAHTGAAEGSAQGRRGERDRQQRSSTGTPPTVLPPRHDARILGEGCFT